MWVRKYSKLHSSLVTALYLLFTSTPVYTSSNDVLSSHDVKTSDWVSLQVRYCGRTCQNGRVVHSELCSYIDCFPCDCDLHCDLLGTCCPIHDKHTDAYTYSFESSMEGNPHQWYNKLECRTPTANEAMFLTVVRCSETWTDQHIKERCEKPKPDSMKSLTPFSDKSTGLVFVNIYCAICNGFRVSSGEDFPTIYYYNDDDDSDNDDGNVGNDDKSGLYPWKLKLECRHFQAMYTITRKIDFFRALPRNNCSYEFVAPLTKPWRPKLCSQPDAINLPPTSSKRCDKSEESLGIFCRDAPAVVALRANGYRNIFCLHACKESLPELKVCKVEGERGTPNIATQSDDDNDARNKALDSTFDNSDEFEHRLSIYFLFSPYFPNQPETEDLDDDSQKQCMSGFWRGFKHECVQILCAPGKQVEKTDYSPTCRTAISDVTGLAYDVNLVLVCLTDIDAYDFAWLEAGILKRLMKSTVAIDLDITYVATGCWSFYDRGGKRVGYTKIVEVHISGFVIASTSISRDEFEAKAFHRFLQTRWEVPLGSSHLDRIYKKAFLQLVAVGRDMCTLYRTLKEPTRDFLKGFPTLPSSRVSTSTLPPKVVKKYETFHNKQVFYSKTTTERQTIKPRPALNPLYGGGIYHFIAHLHSSKQLSFSNSLKNHKLDGENDYRNEYPTTNSYTPSVQNTFSSDVPATTQENSPDFFANLPIQRQIHRDLDYPGFFSSSVSTPNALGLTTTTNRRPVNREHSRRSRSRRWKPDLEGQGSECLAESPKLPMPVSKDSRAAAYKDNVVKFKNTFIDMVATLHCPHIETNLVGYQTLNNGSIQFTISIYDTELNVTYITPDISFKDGKLYFCLDFLINITDNLLPHEEADSPPPLSQSPSHSRWFVDTYYHTKITCTLISVTCLTLTFLTYCLLPTLRSLPGRNIMCLCGSLAIAETLVISPSICSFYFQMSGYGFHAIHCYVHGIVLHYCWLASCCWLNTCCIHMYRVFTSTSNPSAWPVNKTHVHYCLVSFSIPALVVIATIATTHLVTTGESIGYDNNWCIPDFKYRLISILTVFTPVFITMGINSFLFIRTVREMAQITSLQQSRMSSRQGVITYFKLSTVTGLFWTLERAARLVDIPILVLIATPIASLQGVYIFVSFVCNKTIAQHYRDLIESKKSSSTGSSSGGILTRQSTQSSNV